jgi:hypothetical protein
MRVPFKIFKNEIQELTYANRVYQRRELYTASVYDWAEVTLHRYHDKYGTISPTILKELIR